MAICTRKLIKNIGIGGIVWGVINIGIGAVAIQATALNAGILILGVMMLGTGVQALRSPTLGVLLTETIVTVLLFLWNLGISVLNLLAGEPFDPRGLIFPLIIAVVFANNYRKLGHLRDLIAVKCRRANHMDTFSVVVKTGSIYGWSGLPPLIRGNSVITGSA